MSIRFLFFALLAFSCDHVFAADATNPNILLILADDLGYGDVRCYNHEDMHFNSTSGGKTIGFKVAQADGRASGTKP